MWRQGFVLCWYVSAVGRGRSRFLRAQENIDIELIYVYPKFLRDLGSGRLFTPRQCGLGRAGWVSHPGQVGDRAGQLCGSICGRAGPHKQSGQTYTQEGGETVDRVCDEERRNYFGGITALNGVA